MSIFIKPGYWLEKKKQEFKGFFNLDKFVDDKISEIPSTGSSVILSKEITLTPAELYTLSTTPIEILPASVGKSYVIHGASVLMEFNSIVYSGINAFFIYSSSQITNQNEYLFNCAPALGGTDNLIKSFTAKNAGYFPEESILLKHNFPLSNGDSDVKFIIFYSIH